MVWYLNLAFEYSPAYSEFAEFAFFNAAGARAEHSINTPTTVYSYTQLGSDGSGDVANALVVLVNAGVGDPDVTASIGSAAHLVRLDVLNEGLPVAVNALDGGGIGGGSATLEFMQLSTFPRKIAASINTFDWNGPNPSLGLIADTVGTSLSVKAARFGICNVAVDGVTVTWTSGHKFQGLAVGEVIYVDGLANTVLSVTSNTSLVLSTALAGGLSGLRFLTGRGGRDGNFFRLRRQSLRPRSGTVDIAAGVVTHVSGDLFTGLTPDRYIRINNVDFIIATVDSSTQITLTTVTGSASAVTYAGTIEDNDDITTSADSLQLEDGSSGVNWRVALDFSNTLVQTAGDSTPQPIDDLFEAWLTVAPVLADAVDFIDAEFHLLLSNISIADPNSRRPLKVAGPGSTRIHSRQRDVEYEGAGWAEKQGFYDQGFAPETGGWGDRVTVRYRCQSVHNLYVGTEIRSGGASATVTLDGDSPTSLNTGLGIDPPIMAIGRVRTAVPAGVHDLVLTCDGNGQFTFDHIEAAVPSNVHDPAEILSDVSMATD